MHPSPSPTATDAKKKTHLHRIASPGNHLRGAPKGQIHGVDGLDGGFGMTPWCDDLVCSWRRLLADRHSLPFPWTLSLHRRWCPSASHRPLTFLFLPALNFPLPFPFPSLGLSLRGLMGGGGRHCKQEQRGKLVCLKMRAGIHRQQDPPMCAWSAQEQTAPQWVTSSGNTAAKHPPSTAWRHSSTNRNQMPGTGSSYQLANLHPPPPLDLCKDFEDRINGARLEWEPTCATSAH